MATPLGTTASFVLGLLAAAIGFDASAQVFKIDAAISDARLDAMRGGFELGTGVRVSFGIERAVEINGRLVTSTSFQIPDVARISAEQAQQIRAVLGSNGLVRDGVVSASPAGNAVGSLVIQNSLSNQGIRSSTTLNVSTTSLGTLQSLNALAALRDALALP